jgi:predicted membrane-bound spermidine synthase
MGLADEVRSAPAIFALCFAGLVIPTTLMGASLPLLARAVTTTLDSVAERIGTLYGWNTLGAGLGALLGGWVIVGSLGYVGALGLAAGLDVVAALIALTLLRQTAAEAPAAPARDAGPQSEPFGGLGSGACWSFCRAT